MAFPKVRGFDRSGLLSNSDVEELLRTLPPSHVNRIQSVVYIDEVRATGDGQIFGEAVTVSRRALIRIFLQSTNGNMDKDEFREAIYHEVGHCVHTLQLDDALREKWVDLWADAPLGYNPAGVDLHEHFADCYMQFVVHPAVCEAATPAEFGFIKNYVFDGQAEEEQHGHKRNDSQHGE